MTTLERKKRTYTEEEIERGLTILALCGGNHRRAHERLAQMGYDIPGDTLSTWKRYTHPERYAQIREQRAPKIAEAIAAEAEDFAFELAQAERDVLEQFKGQMQELKPAESAAALRNLTTSKSLNVDKIASPLRGRPQVTIRHEHDAEGLMRKLSAMGLAPTTSDGEAIEDAEEVDQLPATDADGHSERTQD